MIVLENVFLLEVPPIFAKLGSLCPPFANAHPPRRKAPAVDSGAPSANLEDNQLLMIMSSTLNNIQFFIFNFIYKTICKIYSSAPIS